MSGMPLPLAMMITIPEPWENNEGMSREKRDFYQYYATMMEPWDGTGIPFFLQMEISWEQYSTVTVFCPSRILYYRR